MTAGLTADTFSRLLIRLDADQEQAAEKYEELRRKLIRFFEWRSAPFPEEQTDEVLNRLAEKIAEGVAVKNIGSYCHEIARFVLLEALKSNHQLRTGLAEIKIHTTNEKTNDDEAEKEIRLACLDVCLRTLPANGRELIVEYYQNTGNQIDHRKALAKRLGLNREALANRAQRLREKLEQCVRRCVSRKISI